MINQICMSYQPFNQTLTVASQLLAPIADKYAPKACLYYPTMRDKWGDYLGEPEDADEQDTICEDCYDKGKIYFRARVKLGKYKEYGCKGIQLNREICGEKENLCLCGFCGEHIETSLLFRDSQEVDHWMENLDDEEFTRYCSVPRDAWQLTQILTSYDAFRHILDDIMPLAIRVIQLARIS